MKTKKKLKQMSTSRNKEWRGYTLDELHAEMALNQVRIADCKQRLAQSSQKAVRPQRIASSAMNTAIKMLSVYDYITIGFAVGRRLMRLLRKKG